MIPFDRIVNNIFDVHGQQGNIFMFVLYTFLEQSKYVITFGYTPVQCDY